MKTKSLRYKVLLMALLLLGPLGCSSEPEPLFQPNKPVGFSQEIVQALEENTQELLTCLEDPSLQRDLKTRNQLVPQITETQIYNWDKAWQTSETTPELAAVDASASSETLKAFQAQRPDYAEIFITDLKGLNVGQTNKTSDYYQGDEAWWQRCTQDLKITHGNIAFDESSQAESISLFLPIFDAESNALLGVCKAVLHVHRVKEKAQEISNMLPSE